MMKYVKFSIFVMSAFILTNCQRSIGIESTHCYGFLLEENSIVSSNDKNIIVNEFDNYLLPLGYVKENSNPASIYYILDDYAVSTVSISRSVISLGVVAFFYPGTNRVDYEPGLEAYNTVALDVLSKRYIVRKCEDVAPNTKSTIYMPISAVY